MSPFSSPYYQTHFESDENGKELCIVKVTNLDGLLENFAQSPLKTIYNGVLYIEDTIKPHHLEYGFIASVVLGDIHVRGFNISAAIYDIENRWKIVCDTTDIIASFDAPPAENPLYKETIWKDIPKYFVTKTGNDHITRMIIHKSGPLQSYNRNIYNPRPYSDYFGQYSFWSVSTNIVQIPFISNSYIRMDYFRQVYIHWPGNFSTISYEYPVYMNCMHRLAVMLSLYRHYTTERPWLNALFRNLPYLHYLPKKIGLDLIKRALTLERHKDYTIRLDAALEEIMAMDEHTPFDPFDIFSGNS